jgi:hypothetical protein
MFAWGINIRECRNLTCIHYSKVDAISYTIDKTIHNVILPRKKGCLPLTVILRVGRRSETVVEEVA